MIIFSEKEHKYVHLETGNTLYGWTSLIKKYTKVFDEENQLTCSAYRIFLGDEEYNRIVKSKFGKLYSLDVSEVAYFLSNNVSEDVSYIRDEIKYEWEYAAILGSEFHKNMEDKAFIDGFFKNPFDEKKYKTIFVDKKYDNQSLCENLFELEDGYYPELIVWDNSIGQEKSPVTQIDSCFIETIGGKRFIDVNDFKSNSKRPVPFKGSYMASPLEDYYDDTISKYKLQAMFGAKLLNTFGFEPRNLAFTHYESYDETKAFIFPAKYDKFAMDGLQKAWKE